MLYKVIEVFRRRLNIVRLSKRKIKEDLLNLVICIFLEILVIVDL